jgi:hypothetical protein
VVSRGTAVHGARLLDGEVVVVRRGGDQRIPVAQMGSMQMIALCSSTRRCTVDGRQGPGALPLSSRRLSQLQPSQKNLKQRAGDEGVNLHSHIITPKTT